MGDGGINIIVAPSKTHKSKFSCRLTIVITQKDPLLLNLIKEGLIKTGVTADKILLRFDGQVHRLKLTDRTIALKPMIEYFDKYPFLNLQQLQYFY